MIVSAKGPNMSTSFRSNLLSSTLNIPRNFEKQSSAMSVISQRSIYYGRETSPTASIRSDLQPRNFHQPFHQQGFTQRSAFNGREGSPMSMRSTDTTASRTTDIVQAIKNRKLNEYERKIVMRALRQHDFKRKAEKRRKMKLYFRNSRNGSGDDSSDQGSDFSNSSDDCMSARTGYSCRYGRSYKENNLRSTNSLCGGTENIFLRDNRETFRHFTEVDSQNPYQRDTDSYQSGNFLSYQKNLQYGNMYLSQKNGPSYKSMLDPQYNSQSGPVSTFSSQKYMNGQTNVFYTQRKNLNASLQSTKSIQNMTMMSQKDRFNGGLQFPSQKFKKSSTVYENHEQVGGQMFPNQKCASNKKKLQGDHIDDRTDENIDINVDTTGKSKLVAKNSDPRQKRKVDSLGNIPVSAKKKPKMTNNDQLKKQTITKITNENNEFEFVKPQFPIRKPGPLKTQEKLISQSTGAPDLIFHGQEKTKPCLEAFLSPEPAMESEQSEITQLTNNDMSMRPSFMKRKLFTQTLDVTERKNNSSDSLAIDSPQSNIYSALTREKHRTRKLVTSQSLLSRDVNQDDNNLLDLIHKIVPPNQVNSTITANTTKTNSRISGNKPADDNEKWDITSIISRCNSDSVSETYTDEEIFKVANDTKNKPKNPKQTSPDDKDKASYDKPGNKQSTLVDLKKTYNVLNEVPLPTFSEAQTRVKDCPAKKVVPARSRIDRFWDTDVESDYESIGTPRAQNEIKRQDQTVNQVLCPKQDNADNQPTISLIKTTKPKESHGLNPKVVIKKDPMILKVLKHQTSKKVQNQAAEKTSNCDAKSLSKKTSDDIRTLKKNDTKLLKRSNDDTKKLKKSNDCTKTLKKLNCDTTGPDEFDTSKKGTTTTTSDTRRYRSSTLDTIQKLRRDKTRLTPNKTLKNKTSSTRTTTLKKQNIEKKVTQKYNKTDLTQKEVDKRKNASQPQINNSKRLEDTPRSQKRTKNTKLRTEEQFNDTFCKTLRSRVIDLSSSFNSDKFELTMARSRKSRTPSKKNALNISKSFNSKSRNRATKA